MSVENFFFNWQLRNLQSTSLGVLSKCVASWGTCKGNLQQGFSLWNVTAYVIAFRCCNRSAGQVRRSLLSIGPLLYKCSIRSLAWLYVFMLYLAAARWISSVILGMWRSVWSSWLLTYQGALTTVLKIWPPSFSSVTWAARIFYGTGKIWPWSYM